METKNFDLRELLGLVWSRKFIIAGVMALTTATSVFASTRRAPVYTACSQVVVGPVVPPAALQSAGYSPTGALGIDLSAESEAQIARSSVVSDRVRTSLKLAGDQALPGNIAVTVLTDSLMRFCSASLRPTGAAQVSNAYADEFLKFRRDRAKAALVNIAKELKQRLDSLNADLAALDERAIALSTEAQSTTDASVRSRAIAEVNQLTSQRNGLFFQLASLQPRYQDAQASVDTAETGGGQIVQPATAPTSPSSPKPVRDGILAFILGGALGLGLAVVRQHFDDRIRTLADVSKAVGILVVGVIPRARQRRDQDEAFLAMTEDSGSAQAEAYRSLRTSLTQMGIGRDAKTVMITSGGARAGKTTTAANLAVAFARTGLRVVAVSADLRAPRLHKFFALENRDGLCDVLSGRLKLDSIAPTRVPNLWVLPSGPVPKNPAELLDSARLEEVMKKLRTVADVIILDGPPLKAGADAAVLASLADTTLLLMRQDSARAGGAVAAADELTQAGATRVVAVMTAVSGGIRGHGYGYGYGKYGRYGRYGYGSGYGSGYGHKPEEPEVLPPTPNGHLPNRGGAFVPATALLGELAIAEAPVPPSPKSRRNSNGRATKKRVAGPVSEDER